MPSADIPSEAVAILLRCLHAKFTNFFVKNLQHPALSQPALHQPYPQLQIDNLALRAPYLV